MRKDTRLCARRGASIDFITGKQRRPLDWRGSIG
jgi:hypothetical protein